MLLSGLVKIFIVSRMRDVFVWFGAIIRTYQKIWFARGQDFLIVFFFTKAVRKLWFNKEKVFPVKKKN